MAGGVVIRLPMIFMRTYGLVAAGLAASVAAGFAFTPGALLSLVTMLMLVTAGCVVLTMHLNRPNFALLALLGTAVAFPIEFRSPLGVMVSSSLPLASAICGLWFLQSWVTRDAAAFDRSRVVVSAVTFLGLTLVSFAMGQFPWFNSGGAPLPAQIAELGLFMVSVGLFLTVGRQVDQVSQLRLMTWVFLAAGAITCVVQSMPALVSVGRWTTRPGSVGGLFWAWFVAVAVAQGVANSQLRMPVRLGCLGLAAMALGHGLIQARSWVSGWGPGLVAIAAILVLRWPRRILGGALLAVPVSLLVAGDVIGSVLAEEAYSLATRQEAWRVLWQIAERSPLLGTGLANYYYFAQNFSILGWYVPFISHNNYEDLLIQTGLLGLLAFLWFGFEAVWMAFRLWRQLPDGFARAYALGVFGGTVGSLASGLLGDWIIPFYYNGGIVGFRSSLLFWVFIGGALALRRIAAAPQRVRVPVPSIEMAASGEYALARTR